MIVMDLDEGLQPEYREVLESHLRGCSACMVSREEFAALFASVAEAAPAEPDQEYWRRYDSSLDAALREKDYSRGWWGFRWKTVGVLLAAGFAFAAVYTSFYDFQKTGVEDRRVSSQLLMEELNELYGPSSDDFLPTFQYRAILTEARTPRGDEAPEEWFEVEDEAGPLWL
jgi:hypothetical protein